MIKEWVRAASEVQADAYALAMRESQPARRVCVFLDNSLPGKFRASELAKKLGVSAATVRKVAKVYYGLKSQGGWFIFGGDN